nr:PREDICTED: probable E3 ubiquitin-protein ligase makorin-1 isoform X2 [Lepisosteus oculatus]
MERTGFTCRANGKRVPLAGRAPCRQFINGCCRFGSNCHFSHELPVLKSTQICKYFQKGGCWFGDRCRYQHVLQPDGGAVGSRRGSAPALQPIWEGSVLQNRRGSEPSISMARGSYARNRRGSEPLVASFASQQRNFERLSVEIKEEEEHAAAEGAPTEQEQKLQMQNSLAVSHNVPQPIDGATSNVASMPLLAVAGVALEDSRGSASGMVASQRGAAPSESRAQAERSAAEAYDQSKDVTCGICMDKVYEKPTPQERRFGILPNCCHAFCLGCIVTWRKTKDFQNEVVKSCPQCRVKSTFYIPNKYWVREGEQKETLISSFKEKSRKIRCGFFTRHGSCPFKSECIYLHELPRGQRPRRLRRSTPVCVQEPYQVNLEDADSDSMHLLQYVITLALLDNDEDEEFLDDYFSLLLDGPDLY